MWLGMVKAALGILGGGCSAGAGARRADRAARPVAARLPRAASRSAARTCREAVSLCRWTPPTRCGRRLRPLVVALVAVRLAVRAARRGEEGTRPAPASPSGRPPGARAAVFRVAVVVLALIVLALATATGLGSPSPPGDLTVRFLDIGQGDATLIQHGDGATVLFDGGPAGGRGLPPAARRGRAGGSTSPSPRIIARPSGRPPRASSSGTPIRLLLDDRLRHPRPRTASRLRDEADAAGIRIVQAHAARSSASAAEILILGPPPPARRPPPEDPNPRGVAAIVCRAPSTSALGRRRVDAILDSRAARSRR